MSIWSTHTFGLEKDRHFQFGQINKPFKLLWQTECLKSGEERGSVFLYQFNSVKEQRSFVSSFNRWTKANSSSWYSSAAIGHFLCLFFNCTLFIKQKWLHKNTQTSHTYSIGILAALLHSWPLPWESGACSHVVSSPQIWWAFGCTGQEAGRTSTTDYRQIRAVSTFLGIMLRLIHW